MKMMKTISTTSSETKNRNERYFQLAKEASLRSTHDRIRIGAVIVKGNWVVSKGFNQAKSHPRQFTYNRLSGRVAPKSHLHAEIDALIKSKDADLSGSSIYVFRETKNGKPALCKPCPACTLALRESGVSEVFFTEGPPN